MINMFFKFIIWIFNIVIYATGFTLIFLFQLIYYPLKIIIDIFKKLLGVKPYSFNNNIYKTNKKNKKKLEFDKNYCLSKEDLRIAKEERMTKDDYIEAEERDDDNLDTDDTL